MHLRLSRFLRTVDYVVQTTLLSIALTSLERLRDTFDRALLLHVTPTSLAGSVVDTPERGSTPHSHKGYFSVNVGSTNSRANSRPDHCHIVSPVSPTGATAQRRTG